MIKGDSFKEKLTRRKKCPGCGQREIPLEEDFCDLCNDNLTGKHDLVKEYRKNNPNDTRKIFEKNGELYVYVEEDNQAQEYRKEIESIGTTQPADLSIRGIFWWTFILFFCPAIILVISSGGKSMLGWIVIVGYISLGLWYYFLPMNVEQRRYEREEREQIILAEREREQQKREEKERLRFKEYEEIAGVIRRMPKYDNWKKEVFKKYGRKCEVRGEENNLEIHHRESIHSIIKRFNIKDIHDAFECDKLWNVNNGSVICQSCHTKTKSHQYRNA